MDKPKHCCEDFAKALQPGTDNEGYGPLILPQWIIDMDSGVWDEFTGAVMIGNQDLAPMRFCPWCAAPVRHASSLFDEHGTPR